MKIENLHQWSLPSVRFVQRDRKQLPGISPAAEWAEHRCAREMIARFPGWDALAISVGVKRAMLFHVVAGLLAARRVDLGWIGGVHDRFTS